MRKPRDFDSELKALADKARQLKERRVRQLGELVTATGGRCARRRYTGRGATPCRYGERRADKGGLAQGGRSFLSRQRRQGCGRTFWPAKRHSPARRQRGIGLRHKRREPTCGTGPSHAVNAPGI